MFDKYLAQNGSLEGIDMEEAKVFFKEAFQKGKAAAKAICRELKSGKAEAA